MSKEQRKLQKRKEREKEVKQQLLVKRTAARSVVRDQLEDFRKEKRVRKIQREFEHFDEIMDERQLMEADDKVLTQIEKNIEILKALEDEHNREVAEKQNLNEELEESGALTLEEKLQAAKNKMASDCGVGGSAECKVSVNRPPKDFAVVDVIKAPQNTVEQEVEKILTENS